MNAGGHIAVALGLMQEGADPGFLLGAALPDLSTMGGFRLLGTTADAGIVGGIALHHRSDDVFHRHSWFTERNRHLIARLSSAGVGRGPARACAHVGIELLLDGELLGDPAIAGAAAEAFGAIESRLDSLLPLVRPDKTAGWRQHLVSLAGRGLPHDYDDATAVAERLYRILERRPRIALEAEHIGTVASALLEAQPSIADTAASLIAELENELRLPQSV